MRLSKEPIISAESIRNRVVELGARISSDYAGKQIVVVVVLKGGLLFAADLVRAIEVPLSVDYIRAKSYDGTDSTGAVELKVLPELHLHDKHVLIVEDILDTGRTTSAVLETVQKESPTSVALCTLLDKPERRIVSVTATYTGFSIPDRFVVGYGLDFNEEYRQLPAIHVME